MHGTTWMIEILSLIRSNGDQSWIKEVPNWERAPWLESTDAARKLSLITQKPRLITSHLAKRIFPQSFWDSKAKVIYTVRNPKDVLVSLYYFSLMTVFYKTPEGFEQFFEYFLKEEIPYGSWFDHVKSWMSLNGQSNFLFITYEELLQDLRGGVLKICKFLGEELENDALERVVEQASFKSMKENKMTDFSLLSECFDQKKSPFLRKGITGDWKNHFTIDQCEYFDRVYQKKMEGFTVMFPWDKNENI